MEYSKFVDLFEAETKAITEKKGWELPFGITEAVTSLKDMKEPLGRALISTFAAAISEGEVSNEMFTSNWSHMLGFVNSIRVGAFKELLKTHVDPQLYLEENEIVEKLKGAFDVTLQKTEEIKKKSEQSGDLLAGLGSLGSLMSGMNREERRSLKKKVKKGSKKGK